MKNKFFQECFVELQRLPSSLQRLLCHVLRSTFYVKRLSFVALRSSFVILFACSAAFANNLTISNVSLETRNAAANTVVVEFDISWDHSWRTSNGEHDAAWVFVKLLDGNTGTPSYPWLHGILYTAGTNPNDGTSVGTNSNIEIVVPSDKIGAFIRRRVTGNGTLSSQNVRLVVDYGTAGAADTDTIQAKVFGIEMVYIPTGPFYIGDGDGGETGEVINTVSGINAGLDGFISAFNSAGTYQWSKRLGGTSDDQIAAIAMDGGNNITVAGYATGSADLNGNGDTADSNEAGNTGVYADVDAFISNFDSSGTFQWSKRLGGTGTDSGYSINVNSSGNLAAVGYITGNADLNGDGDTADSGESSGGVYSLADGFVSVFNSSGTFQWAKRIGGANADIGVLDSAVDNSSNVSITGSVKSSADLTGDGDTADSNETGNTGVYGSDDIFLSVFNSAGTFQWSKRLGGTASFEKGTGITVDSNYNVIVTGFVGGSADLNGDGDTADSNETGNTGVYGSNDVFLSVFNSAGTFQWSKRLGGASLDSGSTVAVNSSNDVIVAGFVTDDADLNGDGDTADSNESTGGVYGNADAFVSVFNSAGTFRWAKRLGGTGDDYTTRVHVDSADRVILVTTPDGNSDLNGDGDTADSNETGNSGVYGSADIAVSVFDSAGTYQWSERMGGTAQDYASGGTSNGGGTSDSSDNVYIASALSGNGDLNGDGDAGLESTHALHKNGVDNTAVQITTTAASITVDTNSTDSIDTSSVSVTGGSGITGNTSWPEGYDAFYVMKYEASQAQYRDFLNTLGRTQQNTRTAVDVSGDAVANYYVMSNGTTPAGRMGIRAPASGNGTTNPITFGCDLNNNGTFNEADDGMTVAASSLTWSDLCAYADWAGLRPITELEYEKMARGSSSAVYGEYAWGSLGATCVSNLSNSGRSNEVGVEKGEGPYNCGSGAYRVGIHATSATSRKGAGAGYYGNMDLSGNLSELVVSLGLSVGRAFTGTHGDGVLTTTSSYEGNATNNDWPAIDATTARGVTGVTGTSSGVIVRDYWSWIGNPALSPISDRDSAQSNYIGRYLYAIRAARTAP